MTEMTITSTDSSGLSPFLIALRTTFIASLGLLIVSGNILSIAVTQRVSNLADSTKVLMTTLAVYDLLFGVSVVLLSSIASALDRWPFGTLGCTLSAAWTNTVFIMSMISIVLLNAERYIAVTRPYKFPVWCTKRRMIALVVLFTALAVSSSMIMQVGVPPKYLVAIALCFYDIGISQNATILAVIFLGIVPTTIMTCVYYRLIKISRQHQLRNNQNGQNEANNIQDNKALKTFLVVTLTLAICYTPMLITKNVEAFTGTASAGWVQFVTGWLTVCNSAFNVFIYCLFNQSYRQRAKMLVSRRFPCIKVSSIAPVDI